ncbi:unnamed protein product [Ranitomeya imitator]|uniref:Uncharacterized protein n=1 Tax=Ranitomeya imitator TaxID=111125 RepID=A0ABN9L6F6_9NEOB|nr:unnamed protein product [Ranitomeya imitator]
MAELGREGAPFYFFNVELAGIEIGRNVTFGEPLMCLNSGNPPQLITGDRKTDPDHALWGLGYPRQPRPQRFSRCRAHCACARHFEDGGAHRETRGASGELGYSIFVVKGDLPDCEADQILQMVRVHQTQRPRLIGEDASLRDQSLQRTVPGMEDPQVYDGSPMMDEDEENLQRALALSRQQIDMEDEEADLRRAIRLSMQGGHRSEYTGTSAPCVQQPSGTSTESLTQEELPKDDRCILKNSMMSEDDMLRAAMKMSLDTGGTKSEDKDK